MGNFSRDTFDKEKHYVGVRLQQGIPLLDADWNEQEDIRRYELRTFIQHYMGNGVPPNSNAFRITPIAGNQSDFNIEGGDGTIEGAGHCLVAGWEVIIKETLKYTEQFLYGNDASAQQWKVPPLAPLTIPEDQDRTDFVYLDVWEREVDAKEDEELIDPSIGIETCVRIKREWVVRVAEDTSSLPTPSLGHVFYALAKLQWQWDGKETKRDIIDLRTTAGQDIEPNAEMTWLYRLLDSRQYERQMILKKFMGNGVPQNSDAFLIRAVADQENDFEIVGGDGSKDGAEICLVAGWSVFIPETLKYSQQLLYEDETQAQQWGITPLQALTTPQDQERTDIVYLDIWKRELDAHENDTLIYQDYDIATGVRIKLEWVVRVAEGISDLPTPPSEHVFYTLATLKRGQGQAIIYLDSITDLRTIANRLEPTPLSSPELQTTTGPKPSFESDWLSYNAEFEGWIDVAVGFFPKNVSVIAQMTDTEGNYGDNVTQINPISLTNITNINTNLITETSFMMTSGRIRIFKKASGASNGTSKVRFKVYALE